MCVGVQAEVKMPRMSAFVLAAGKEGRNGTHSARVRSKRWIDDDETGMRKEGEKRKETAARTNAVEGTVDRSDKRKEGPSTCGASIMAKTSST